MEFMKQDVNGNNYQQWPGEGSTEEALGRVKVGSERKGVGCVLDVW